MRRMPGRLHPAQGADRTWATGKTPGDACPASFNNLTSSRICPANERETSGKGPERPYASSSLPGTARTRMSRRATARPASHPGARPPDGGWIPSVSALARTSHHEITELEIPHVARIQLVSAPHGRPYERHQVEYPLGTFTVGCDADRALDRLARIGDRSTAPSADLVAEQPEPPGPSGPNRALGDDAALGSPLVWDRRHLDDELTLWDGYLQRGVVEVAARTALGERLDRLVDLPVPADDVGTRAQRDPEEIDGRGG
jgi:hypothetical protein